METVEEAREIITRSGDATPRGAQVEGLTRRPAREFVDAKLSAGRTSASRLKGLRLVEIDTEDRPNHDREQHFQRLFDRYYRPITRFFRNRGFDAEQALDLAQETFIGVYRGVDRFRHESSEETWLFKIAKNIWRNEIRSTRAEKRSGHETSLEWLLEQGVEPTDIERSFQLSALEGCLGHERSRLLYEAMEGLPPQMRRCIVLRVAHDLKYREIAELMQISIQTVRSQLFQARSRLRDSLWEYFDDSLDDPFDDPSPNGSSNGPLEDVRSHAG